MKTWKKNIITVMFVIIVLALIGCSNMLSGTWKHESGQTIKFTGKNFEIYTGLALSNFISGPASRNNGTYSISNDKIEIIFSDGHIDVYSFSRTENTLTINGRRLTR